MTKTLPKPGDMLRLTNKSSHVNLWRDSDPANIDVIATLTARDVVLVLGTERVDDAELGSLDWIIVVSRWGYGYVDRSFLRGLADATW